MRWCTTKLQEATTPAEREESVSSDRIDTRYTDELGVMVVLPTSENADLQFHPDPTKTVLTKKAISFTVFKTKIFNSIIVRRNHFTKL